MASLGLSLLGPGDIMPNSAVFPGSGEVLIHGAALLISLVSDGLVARIIGRSDEEGVEALADAVTQGEKNAGEAQEAAGDASAYTANNALATFTTRQLESKWKHAADFGITTPKRKFFASGSPSDEWRIQGARLDDP